MLTQGIEQAGRTVSQGTRARGSEHSYRLLWVCWLAEGRLWSMAVDAGMGWLWLIELLTRIGRSWRVAMGRNLSPPSAEKLVLGPHLLLVSVEGRSPGLDQGILDRANHIGRKDGVLVNGPRDRLLPGLQHLLHFPAGAVVDRGIRVHECRVQILAKE